jgi:prevent-host-death family protein
MSTTPTPLTVTANEARLQFSDLINRAIYTKQPTIITRQRKPAVVLVNYEDWLALQPSAGVFPVGESAAREAQPESGIGTGDAVIMIPDSDLANRP